MTATEYVGVEPLAMLTVVGESAVRVTGRTGDPEMDWRLVHKLADHIHAQTSGPYTGAVPTYESVLVEFDSASTDLDLVREELRSTLETLRLDTPLRPQPLHFRVPVLYGGVDPEDPFGPDMHRVSEITGLEPREIVARHSGPTYVIRCLGAPGGSPMVYGPDLGAPVPRLTSPRTSVPQGAVSLAGLQATITPTSAPGGWSVIGRTPLRLLQLTEDSVVPYRPGDTLQFFPVGQDEFRDGEGHQMTAEQPA